MEMPKPAGDGRCLRPWFGPFSFTVFVGGEVARDQQACVVGVLDENALSEYLCAIDGCDAVTILALAIGHDGADLDIHEAKLGAPTKLAAGANEW